LIRSSILKVKNNKIKNRQNIIKIKLNKLSGQKKMNNFRASGNFYPRGKVLQSARGMRVMQIIM